MCRSGAGRDRLERVGGAERASEGDRKKKPAETQSSLIISAIFLIFFIIRFFTMRGRYMSLTGIHLNLTNALFIVIGIISVVMFAVRPVSDWIYYVISFATAGAVAFSVTSLIHGYNMLSSVKPKQFSRSGGDDNA